MARENEGLELLVARAKEHETKYDWSRAAEIYQEALKSIPEEDALNVGRILEKQAYALQKAAFQAASSEEFASRIRIALDEYDKARRVFGEISGPAALAIATRCEAMRSHVSSWVESDVSRKKELVDDAWRATKQALSSFSASEDSVNLAATYNELHLNAALAWNMEGDPETRSSIVEDLIRYGEEAAEKLVDDPSNQEEIAKTLVNLAASLEAAATTVKNRVYNAAMDRARQCLQKAMGLCRDVTVVEAVYGGLLIGVTLPSNEGEGAAERIKRAANMMLEASEKTRDRLLLGLAHSEAAGVKDWIGAGTEIPEEAVSLFDSAKCHSEQARSNFACLGFIAPDFQWYPWASAPASPWYNYHLAQFETDLAKKRELVDDAVTEARRLCEYAEKSGYPWARGVACFTLGLALNESVEGEGDYAKKRAIIQEALAHWRVAMEAEDRYDPGHFWNRGVTRCQFARAQQSLLQLMEDGEEKAEVAKSSSESAREGLQLISKWYELITSGGKGGTDTLHSGIGFFREMYGRSLVTQFGILGDRRILRSAIEAFEQARGDMLTGGMANRAAECHWEAARVHDVLGEYLESSRTFQSASSHYTEAAQKVKSLSRYYQEFATYMNAWSEIELAKYHHARQEPVAAREHYRKASELHSATRQWNYLAANYSALSEIENAEDMSQREDFDSSKASFRRAVKLLSDSRKVLKNHVDTIESPDEKNMVAQLIESTDLRIDLCRARSALEEARQMDKQGEMRQASDRYGQVAEMLEPMLGETTAEQDAKEIRLMITLAKAWQAMSRAEAEASPEFYEEAARLFEEAKNASPGERAKNLTLGHSRFCRALGLGARYADSSDVTLHQAATDHLESAARYYVKAKFGTAAEYARASKLLFDAYAHMGLAGKETNPQRKAKAFAMAEKLFEASATSYDKAGQSGRKEQVLKMLDMARRERQLAVSLAQIFLAPDEASTTLTFSSPSVAQETAVGLDKFEHADVQATLIASPKSISVGQEFVLEIEMVNAGRGPAQLTKISDIIPEGFAVVSEPDRCRIRDNHVDLKGRKLNALKTEDVRFVLKPTAKGDFKVKPRVMYLDESGSYKSCIPDPIEIRVKELGISGWLRGPDARG